MGPHHFVTVDAETEAIQEGVRAISALREEVEAREGIDIPLVWFVRFQRGWQEYVDNDAPAAFEGPMTTGYDGFELAGDQLRELVGRGDEVGWHYHAYHYVHRDDIPPAARLEILRADLTACARELRTRHPEFEVQSFRFGWFFVPDYGLYDHLKTLGISRDASIHPEVGGEPVAAFSARFLLPLATVPTRLDGFALFPYTDTLLVHDWQVVAHDFGWSRLDAPDVPERRRELTGELSAIAARLKRDGGEFLTYATAPPSLLE